jgi:hypothetical protein
MNTTETTAAAREPAGEPLIMPADEFAVLRNVAERLGVARPTGDTGRPPPASPAPSRDRPGASPPERREALGRLVHDTRLAHEAERAAAEGRQRFNLPPWEERTPEQRELDMRIGEAVAAQARTDARLNLTEAAIDRAAEGLVRITIEQAVSADRSRIAAECERLAAWSPTKEQEAAYLAAAAMARGDYRNAPAEESP